MAIKKTRIIKYELENPHFKGVEFTEHSNEWLDWPKAVRFASEQGDGSILQSAREAAAFRIEAEGDYDADLYQATRNVALYFKVGDKFYCAIDDIADPEQNIVIARAEESFKSHSNHGKYILPVNDSLVKGVLSRAEKTGRIVEATESLLELKTKTVKEKSEFGQNDWNKAILLDVAESYAQMLNKRGYKIGRVWSLTPESLEEIGVDGNSVEVRPVGLGDNDYYSVNDVVAVNLFDYDGRSCGVRRAKNFSTGNKGRLVKLDKRVYANIRKMLNFS
ncbi:hypothetical protein KY304_01300 [Candidatus Woesearchaeota archaeon]|nr:hypothetical protein [Candidatus Woesearchaeota archaeon]